MNSGNHERYLSQAFQGGVQKIKVKIKFGWCLNTRFDQKERQDIRNQSGADRNSVADLDDGSKLRAAVLVEVTMVCEINVQGKLQTYSCWNLI